MFIISNLKISAMRYSVNGEVSSPLKQKITKFYLRYVVSAFDNKDLSKINLISWEINSDYITRFGIFFRYRGHINLRKLANTASDLQRVSLREEENSCLKPYLFR